MNRTSTNKFQFNKDSNTVSTKKKDSVVKLNEDKNYKPLNRQDFDTNVKKYWAEICLSKPPIRRTNHVSFIYNDYFYIFGGRDINQTKMNDMHRIKLSILQKSNSNEENELTQNCEKWELIEPEGDIPDPIAEHKGVLIQDKYYVFGGVGNSLEVNNNLYIYDIPKNTWTKKTFDPNEIPPRSGHSISLITNEDTQQNISKNTIVIFGGYYKGRFSNAVLMYDVENETWDIHDPCKTLEMAQDTEENNELLELDDKVYDETSPNATSKVSQNNLQQNVINKASQKNLQGVVNKTSQKNIKVSQKSINEKAQNIPETEIQEEPKKKINFVKSPFIPKEFVACDDYPEPRINNSQISYLTQIIIYGGINPNGKYLDDIWKFNIILKEWTKITIDGEIPKGRQGHSTIIKDDVLYIFGGETGNIFEVNEFWKFDLNTNRFTLIHDTLLEREAKKEKLEKTKTKVSNNNNLYQTFYKTKKTGSKPIKIIAEDNGNKGQKSIKNFKNNMYDEVIKADTKVKMINNSLIYKISHEDANYISKLTQASKNIKYEKIRYGELPLPRDGHTAILYNNKMLIFGGDRNKFPFNEIFIFDFQKEEEEKESNNLNNLHNLTESTQKEIDNNNNLELASGNKNMSNRTKKGSSSKPK